MNTESGIKTTPLLCQTLKQASFDTHSFIGDSGIKVSKICLGTITFGAIDKRFGDRPGQLNEADAHAVLDRFVELGGNFIDTGAFYPFFGSTSGTSETIIGNWLARQDRKKIVLMTNAGFPTDFNDVNAVSLSRLNLLNSLETSLKRLRTSYVDLLCINGWDETTNVGDIMRTLNDCVRSGRVRHIGCANLKACQMQACLNYARSFNMEKIMTISCEYNLLSRGADLEIFDICRLRHVSMLAHSPLKGGYLTGKIKPRMTKAPANTRIAAASRDTVNVAALALPLADMVNNEVFIRVIEACEAIAKKHGKTVAQVALRYLLHNDCVSSIVIGVTSHQQLDENMDCLSFCLEQVDIDELNRASVGKLQAPYNIDAYLKLTRSRDQLRHSVVPTTLSCTNCGCFKCMQSGVGWQSSIVSSQKEGDVKCTTDEESKFKGGEACRKTHKPVETTQAHPTVPQTGCVSTGTSASSKPSDCKKSGPSRD